VLKQWPCELFDLSFFFLFSSCFSLFFLAFLLSLFLFVSSVRPSIHPSIYPFIYPFLCIYITTHLYIFIYLPLCLSVLFYLIKVLYLSLFPSFLSSLVYTLFTHCVRHFVVMVYRVHASGYIEQHKRICIRNDRHVYSFQEGNPNTPLHKILSTFYGSWRLCPVFICSASEAFRDSYKSA
jgi:hypothetical protein